MQSSCHCKIYAYKNASRVQSLFIILSLTEDSINILDLINYNVSYFNVISFACIDYYTNCSKNFKDKRETVYDYDWSYCAAHKALGLKLYIMLKSN